MDTFANDKEFSYQKKVWIKGGIYALIVVLLLLLKATFSVFLLILAGSLIAVFFRGLSGLICSKTKWKEGVYLAISVIGTLLLVIGLFWLIGAKVQNQITELSDTLPSTVENAKAQLSQNPLGQKIAEKVSSAQSMKKAQGLTGTFFKSTFGVLGDIYVVVFLGIFFTVSPDLYKKGMIILVPKKGQQKAEDVLNKLGDNLKKWLRGKLFSMFVVFILTAIMGMPLWLTLALIAGLLSFIPNFGPILALIPAVLVAFMQSPVTAAVAAGMYIVIQVIESNFITPFVQQKLINTPPALIIIAQMIMGALTGGVGSSSGDASNGNCYYIGTGTLYKREG